MKKLFYVLFLLVSAFSFVSGKVYAQDAFPGATKCDPGDTKDPEYASGRPYQASMCGDRPITYACGNTVVAVLNNVKCNYNGSPTCTPNETHFEQKIVIDLTNVELPILGNTDDTENSQSAGTLDEGQKVNNYLAWYLGGADTKLEGEEATDEELVNFSGPVRKLLPGIIQDAQRIKTIKSATEIVPVTDEETAITTEEAGNHNHIVVCAKQGDGGFLGWIKDLFGIGVSNPVPCYDGDGSKANNDVYRLTDWDGELSWTNAVGNTLVSAALNFFQLVYPFASIAEMEASIGDHYNFRKPPLPWDDGTGKPYATNVLYQKAYYEWRGQTCLIIPVANKLACFENFLVPNKYADLFPYVPLAITSDKKGSHLITGTGFRAPRATLGDTWYNIVKNPALWVPHTEENYQLLELLKSTYKTGAEPDLGGVAPKGDPAPIPPDVEINSTCKIINARSNPGDLVTFENPESYMEIDVKYDVTEVECSEPKEVCRIINDPKNPQYGKEICRMEADCSSDIYALIPAIGKHPYADEIWESSVAGADSAFRRIFPKSGPDAPVSCIADLPAESKATYTVNDRSDRKVSLWKVELPDGSAVSAAGGSDNTVDAKLFYPHYGGVLEYFLKGVQTALRPKGYGETLASSQYCSNIICGELPEDLPKAEGACKLGGVSSRVGPIPDSLKDIVSAAAETFKVQPGLILGMMFGEGAFNTDSSGKNYTKYNWTDQNVKNWATCQPLPNCSDPLTSIVSGLNLNWKEYEKMILPEIQKFDPEAKEADACNLIHEVYAIAANLKSGVGGGVDLKGKQCYGITMTSAIPTSCDWSDSMLETAIRAYEYGAYYNPQSSSNPLSCPWPNGCRCATKPGGCARGGFENSACEDMDNCEKVGGSGNTSHNACVFDVAKGN